MRAKIATLTVIAATSFAGIGHPSSHPAKTHAPCCGSGWGRVWVVSDAYGSKTEPTVAAAAAAARTMLLAHPFNVRVQEYFLPSKGGSK